MTARITFYHSPSQPLAHYRLLFITHIICRAPTLRDSPDSRKSCKDFTPHALDELSAASPLPPLVLSFESASMALRWALKMPATGHTP